MSAVQTLTAAALPSLACLQLGKRPILVGDEDSFLSTKKAWTAKECVAFDPARHIEHTPPSKVYSMSELGYSNSKGVSPIGVSEPFPLFSAEAIWQMRAEVLSSEVREKYEYSSELAQSQLRGYAAECAPFVYEAWKNPETLAIVSKIAGVDLVPVMDLEIGHTNLSMSSEETRSKELVAAVEKKEKKKWEAKDNPQEDESPIVDWHTDSYPFVCVTMLSDCTDMVGGETALRKGNGEVVKVRGPQTGWAVILQGRYIEHQALRALGITERISMVTSFRPRSSAIQDDTVLTTVRPVSDLGELYYQFAEYRFEMLRNRLQDANNFMRDQKQAQRRFDTSNLKQFIRAQIDFLEHMDREIVEDDKVQKGVVDDSHLVSEDLKQKRSQRHVRVAVAE
ncbi:hypothetical protein N7510_007150 [Penicillium lagena]|uniref:uncharacterized protein n=1 Tax=Penicillium lagena TaxID=94218 RepID=UPI00253FF2C5|nr:uncharacterized protein N7510_007150 [Penicillium lagena]KAJ5610431.1 hypothetical protein N7510_007150 [Penicillium lagena]